MAAPNIPPLTLDDVRDSQRLFYYLRQLSARIASVTPMAASESPTAPVIKPPSTAATKSTSTTTPTSTTATDLTPQQLEQIRFELSAAGHHSLPVEGLQGRTSQAQRAALIIFSSDPTTTIDANLYDVGTMGTFGGNFYYVVAGNPHTWSTVSLATAPHSVLSATHADTLAAAVVRGDLIAGNATPNWSRLALGTAFQLLRVNAGATDPEWGAVSDAMLSGNVALLNAAINTFANIASFQGTVNFGIEAATTATYTISGLKFFVGNAHVGATTIKMPSAPAFGDAYVICDGLGQAAAFNLTINGNGANIDGAATLVLNTNWAVARLFWTGGIWKTW